MSKYRFTDKYSLSAERVIDVICQDNYNMFSGDASCENCLVKEVCRHIQIGKIVEDSMEKLIELGIIEEVDEK